MEIVTVLLLVLFIISAVLLALIVLVQDEQGEGMGGIFGGGSSSAFGSRSGNILTRTTGILATVFLLSAVFLALQFKTPDTGDAARTAYSAQSGLNPVNKEEFATPDPEAPKAAEETKTDLESATPEVPVSPSN